MICSWLISLAAHINFRRRLPPAQLAKLPLRSPLGDWGSPIGVLLVSAALLETWLNPRVNLYSGLACIGLVGGVYILVRRKKQPGTNRKFHLSS